MENLQLPGSFIRNADIRPSESGAFVRIHITAEFTEDLLEKMGWEDPGESSRKTRMTGELPEGSFSLEPNEASLKMCAITFPFSGARDFDVVTITKEESRRREVRFTVHSEALESPANVFNYIRALKKTTGMLRLSYSGVQEPLAI